MMPDQAMENQEAKLPEIRQDLVILPSKPFWNGAPSWVIHDALANKYYRIGERELGALSRWRNCSSGQLAEKLSGGSGKPGMDDQTWTSDELETLARFLIANHLTVSDKNGGWQNYMRQREASRQAIWKQAVHKYLFFRIPLINPQKFLNAVWPFLSFLFTRAGAVAFTLIAMGSLYLVSHQWEEFEATFVSFLTIEGLAVYLLSLVGIKIIHEFGHALMATKYRVSVPVIGAAFIVMMPILYTDTTAAHRLQSRWQRLNIDLAGIYAELALATIATCFWIFLPDGPLRSVAFTTATLSWILSLAVNLNPFMRFDGYYILGDLFGFDNLQGRGFEFGKWKLREILFRIGAPTPELVPQSWHWPIVLHAWGTWVYRFFLFLGIALLVYAFFIKLVGIALFFIEIIWFIAKPVWREMNTWWSLREKIMKTKRSLITGAVGLAALAILFTPFKTRVDIPALLQPLHTLALFPPQQAILVQTRLASHKRVKAGEALATFKSPDLDEARQLNKNETALLKARLARTSADVEDLSQKLVLEKELQANLEQADFLERRQNDLTLRAPTNGVLLDIDPNLTAGIWTAPNQQLGLVGAGNEIEVSGYVAEALAAYVSVGKKGVFIPDALQLPKIAVRLEEINKIPAEFLEHEYLANIHGSRIPVQPNNSPTTPQNKLKPKGSWYGVRLSISKNIKIPSAFRSQLVRGIVHIEGERRSIAGRILKQVAGVLLREFSP